MLANPLMLWLASTVYADRNPGDLADRHLFGSSSAIEHYLLDEFIPAMYAGRAWQSDSGGFHCTAMEARHWLGFLAYSVGPVTRYGKRRDWMEDEAQDEMGGASELAWWQFRFAADRSRLLRVAFRAAMLCSVAWALLIWVLTLNGNWRYDAYSGPLKPGNLLLTGPVGRFIRPTFTQLAIATPKTVREELQRGLAHLLNGLGGLFYHPLTAFAAIGFFVVVEVVLWNDMSKPRRLKVRPLAAIGNTIAAMIFCCFTFGAVVAFAFLPAHGSHYRLAALKVFLGEHSTWTSVLAVSLIGLTAIPWAFTTLASTSGITSPPESLRLDRRADIVVTLPNDQPLLRPYGCSAGFCWVLPMCFTQALQHLSRLRWVASLPSHHAHTPTHAFG